MRLCESIAVQYRGPLSGSTVWPPLSPRAKVLASDVKHSCGDRKTVETPEECKRAHERCGGCQAIQARTTPKHFESLTANPANGGPADAKRHHTAPYCDCNCPRNELHAKSGAEKDVWQGGSARAHEAHWANGRLQATRCSAWASHRRQWVRRTPR